MPRNKEQNEKIKVERLEQILDGALELFALNGTAGTKISDIAAHTNMSNGLVYHYFPSKEDLFTELIRIAFDRMVKACRILESMSTPPHEKIKFALNELVNIINSDKNAALFFLLIAQAAASKNIPHEADEILEKNRRIPYEIITGIIADGQKLGTIRDGRAEDMAFFFWVNINGIAMLRAMHGDKAKIPDPDLLYPIFFETEAG